MKRAKSLVLTGIALSVPLLLTCACNSENNKESKLSSAEAADSTRVLASSTAGVLVPDTSRTRPGLPGPQSGPATLSLPDGEHLIPIPWAVTNSWLLKSASLDLWVSDAAVSGRRLKYWLGEAQGYYSNWNQGQRDDSLQIDLKAIIPSSAYETFKDSVESLGAVKVESAQADDITDKVLTAAGMHKVQQSIGAQNKDLESRLHKGADQLTAQAQSESYQLASENTQEELTSMRRQVSRSELDIHISQYIPSHVPTFQERLGNQLYTGWASLEVILMILASIWPWIIFIGIGVYLWRQRKGLAWKRGAKAGA
jgi:hypothetical protein